MSEETFFVYNENGASNIVLTVEHAGNEWPAQEDIYGMPEGWQDQHYAYDFGVKDFALRLAAHFDCPVVLGRYSRVLVDLNRIPGEDDIVRTSNDGVEFPMNADPYSLQDARIRNYFVPYHTKIRQLLSDPERKHVSIHSYTRKKMTDPPETDNPWQLGIQYPCKTPLVDSALEYYSKLDGVVIGDNQPYNLRMGLPGAISLHAAPFGRDTVELEFRDDQFRDPALREFWYNVTAQWLSYHASPRPKNNLEAVHR